MRKNLNSTVLIATNLFHDLIFIYFFFKFYNMKIIKMKMHIFKKELEWLTYVFLWDNIFFDFDKFEKSDCFLFFIYINMKYMRLHIISVSKQLYCNILMPGYINTGISSFYSKYQSGKKKPCTFIRNLKC